MRNSLAWNVSRHQWMAGKAGKVMELLHTPSKPCLITGGKDIWFPGSREDLTVSGFKFPWNQSIESLVVSEDLFVSDDPQWLTGFQAPKLSCRRFVSLCAYSLLKRMLFSSFFRNGGSPLVALVAEKWSHWWLNLQGRAASVTCLDETDLVCVRYPAVHEESRRQHFIMFSGKTSYFARKHNVGWIFTACWFLCRWVISSTVFSFMSFGQFASTLSGSCWTRNQNSLCFVPKWSQRRWTQPSALIDA